VLKDACDFPPKGREAVLFFLFFFFFFFFFTIIIFIMGIIFIERWRIVGPLSDSGATIFYPLFQVVVFASCIHFMNLNTIF